MSRLEALWLGIVQGLTEFFPVSSSGHLVLLQSMLGIEVEGLVFEVAVHVATLIAIALFYHRRLIELVVGVLLRQSDSLRYVGKLAVATLPAVAVGLGLRDLIDSWFASPLAVACLLIATGGIVWTTRFTRGNAVLEEPTWGGALLIGLAQALAILPGISRSGSTVAAALAVGVAPTRAAEFSFLLGIIAITGAAVLILPDLAGVDTSGVSAIGVGSLAALASGLGALWLFVRMLRTNAFHHFAWWAWGAGGAYLLWQLG
jgi:undecaprenyl-diphosphatase